MDNLTVIISAAREYYDRDIPIPVDLYMELQMEGLCPEQLEEMFEAGIPTEEIVFHYYE